MKKAGYLVEMSIKAGSL